MDQAASSVLVTGGAGFIGSHLADALLAAGHRVVVLDDLSTGRRERVPSGVRFAEGDVRNFDLEGLLREEKVAAVFHHAAQIDVRRSVEDPLFDAEVNVLGTIRLARASVAAGVSQLLFASSGGAIYGDPRGFAADEEHPTYPVSPYGTAKLAAEKYLECLAHDTPLAVTLLRYANVYGPRQDGSGEAGVVGIWMRRLLNRQDAVIYGDGAQSRDFIYVGDVVAANLVAFRKRAAGVFNVGTGIETTVNDLYRHVAAACGWTRAARHEAGKPGEQRRSVLAVGRAARELGFSPAISLPAGLRRTAEWFRDPASRSV